MTPEQEDRLLEDVAVVKRWVETDAPNVVTKKECEATRAKQDAIDLRAALNGNRGKEAKRVAANFAIKLALLAGLSGAVFTGIVAFLVFLAQGHVGG